jgi:putative membrane protein
MKKFLSAALRHIPSYLGRLGAALWSVHNAIASGISLLKTPQIWRIWPAVLLHTLFAAAVVGLSITIEIEVPPVMLTVLGVVIGFVIAYRVGSGYDRYWMGRVCWSELIRNSRTMSRLIWFHVPPLVSQKTAAEIASGKLERSREEQLRVMEEKRHALDLIEGFAVATKHHLRGELGIYFEDLYHLVKPLHEVRLPFVKQCHC